MASVVIVFLAFSSFLGISAIVTHNRLTLLPNSWADDERDSEEEDEEEENEDSEEPEEKEENEDSKKQEETKKKNDEQRREQEKKDAERKLESQKKVAEKIYEKEDEGEEYEDDEVKDDTESEDVPESEHGMYQEKDKTLLKLRQDIVEAQKHLLEKQKEGTDTSSALTRLNLAESDLEKISIAFDTNNLEEAKMLTKQVKRTTHSVQEDLHDTKKIAEEISKVEKRFAQVAEKIVILNDLHGDTTLFKNQLSYLQADFSFFTTLLSMYPDTVTRDTIRVFEKRVQRLQSLIEANIIVLGGDDDILKHYDDEADELFKDMEYVADFVDGDDNNVSHQVRGIATEQKIDSVILKQKLAEANSRSALTKTLFGPESDALAVLSTQATAIDNRATTLENVATQMTDPAVKEILMSQVSVLRSEATKLQAYITAENNTFNFAHWFAKLF